MKQFLKIYLLCGRKLEGTNNVFYGNNCHIFDSPTNYLMKRDDD